MIAHSDDHDPIQGGVGLWFLPIEAMAVRFAARGWNRTGAAEFGESGLGTDAFGIVSPTRISISAAVPVEIHGLRGGRRQDAVNAYEIGIMSSDFGIERQPAARDSS